MLLDELGNYLQGQGLGVLGTDLFLGTLPIDAPGAGAQDAVTALVETPGFPAQFVHSTLGPDWEQPVLQILVRGAPYDYAGARSHAQDVFLALGKISNQALSGTPYLWCQPIQSVFKLRDDDYSRPIMTCQFRIGKSI
jgi:hypothetical protein